MNKMVVVAFLCLTTFAMGMEEQLMLKKEKLESYSFLVTSEENQKFESDLAKRLDFCRTVTADSKYVSRDNPIYKMIERLSQDFKECNNDVLKLIESQGLAQRINMYEKEANSNDIVGFCLKQIHIKEGDVTTARYFVGKSRELLAEIKLSTLRLYECQPLGVIQIQDKIDYMKANAHYPTNDQAVKDFMALIIYQNIFAHQTHKK